MDKKVETFVSNYHSLICSDSIKCADRESSIALLGFYSSPLEKEFTNAQYVDLQSLKSQKWDYIIAPLLLSSFERKNVVPFLFEIFESLNKNGTVFLSFSMLDKLELVKGVEKESYHDKDLTFVEYRYRVEDVVTALNSIGFKTKEFDKIDTSFGSFATLCASV